MTQPIHAVLFDLDGTLVDSAPDLAATINRLREEHLLPPLPFNLIRPIANLGSKALIKLAFDIDDKHPHFLKVRDRFFALYQDLCNQTSRLFPDIDQVLLHLEEEHIPWGIVTNKLTRHTHTLLTDLNLMHRSACVVCGDTLPTNKPNPEPILHACWLLQQEPAHCLYVGDAMTDVSASRAAGTKSIVALYGYTGISEDPYTWQADGYIKKPLEILKWL
jgi:N-acetyl-D-muramate 6-phosphate phosphatase